MNTEGSERKRSKKTHSPLLSRRRLSTFFSFLHYASFLLRSRKTIRSEEKSTNFFSQSIQTNEHHSSREAKQATCCTCRVARIFLTKTLQLDTTQRKCCELLFIILWCFRAFIEHSVARGERESNSTSTLNSSLVAETVFHSHLRTAFSESSHFIFTTCEGIIYI